MRFTVKEDNDRFVKVEAQDAIAAILKVIDRNIKDGRSCPNEFHVRPDYNNKIFFSKFMCLNKLF